MMLLQMLVTYGCVALPTVTIVLYASRTDDVWSVAVDGASVAYQRMYLSNHSRSKNVQMNLENNNPIIRDCWHCPEDLTMLSSPLPRQAQVIALHCPDYRYSLYDRMSSCPMVRTWPNVVDCCILNDNWDIGIDNLKYMSYVIVYGFVLDRLADWTVWLERC